MEGTVAVQNALFAKVTLVMILGFRLPARTMIGMDRLAIVGACPFRESLGGASHG